MFNQIVVSEVIKKSGFSTVIKFTKMPEVTKFEFLSAVMGELLLVDKDLFIELTCDAMLGEENVANIYEVKGIHETMSRLSKVIGDTVDAHMERIENEIARASHVDVQIGEIDGGFFDESHD